MNQYQRCPICTQVIFEQAFCSVKCEKEFKRQVDQANSTVNYKGGDMTKVFRQVTENEGVDKMDKKMKFYQFQHSDGSDIIVAEFGRQAINFYINNYQDDTNVDDIMDTGGLRVRELTDQEINRVRKIYNEDKSDYELLSYKDVAKELKVIPDVIITPHY